MFEIKSTIFHYPNGRGTLAYDLYVNGQCLCTYHNRASAMLVQGVMESELNSGGLSPQSVLDLRDLYYKFSITDDVVELQLRGFAKQTQHGMQITRSGYDYYCKLFNPVRFEQAEAE